MSRSTELRGLLTMHICFVWVGVQTSVDSFWGNIHWIVSLFTSIIPSLMWYVNYDYKDIDIIQPQ